MFDVALAWPGRRFHVSTDQLRVLVQGPSGSGKTTAVRAIAGVTPANGHVRIGGHDLSSLPPEQRRLGWVPQDVALFPHLDLVDVRGFEGGSASGAVEAAHGARLQRARQAYAGGGAAGVVVRVDDAHGLGGRGFREPPVQGVFRQHQPAHRYSIEQRRKDL